MQLFTLKLFLLATSGLSLAQDLNSCPLPTIDFEDLPGVSDLGGVLGILNPLNTINPIPQGYRNLQWAGFFGIRPSPVLHTLLPQGLIYAVAPNNPYASPPVISAPQEGLKQLAFRPLSIFIGTSSLNQLGGAMALPRAAFVIVTAVFFNGYSQSKTFEFDPPTSILGLNLDAEALQYFRFPCEWTDVVSLTFQPIAKSGPSDTLRLAIDNFEIESLVPLEAT